MGEVAEIRKKKLQNKVLQEKRHVLWSYDLSAVSELPDELVIEKLLQFGNKEDWNELAAAYDRKQIQSVWESQMLMSGRELDRQKEIVQRFFHIKNPAKYIADKKRRRLNFLIEKGRGRTGHH